MELQQSSRFELHPDEEYDKFCGKVFLTTKKNVVIHCMLCESKFRGFDSYMNHITLQHPTDTAESLNEESSESGEDNESQSIDEAELPLKYLENKKSTCREQKKKPTTKGGKDSKKSQHHERTLPVITEVEIRKSRPTQIVSSETGLFACPYCTQRFPLEYLLKAHVKEHDENRCFKCNICGTQCKSHGRLRQHMRRHEKNKPHKCSECERSFVNQSELKYHMRNHNNEKPYQCEDCGNVFAYKCTLRMHRKRHHTFQKDYVCPICSQAFYCARFLRDHMTKHTNEPSYECPKCGKKFNTSSCYGRHRAQHRQEETEKGKFEIVANETFESPLNRSKT